MFRLTWVIFRLILEPVNFYQAYILGSQNAYYLQFFFVSKAADLQFLRQDRRPSTTTHRSVAFETKTNCK
jgi:hypothetical protein